jgi:hypothetical protein
MTLRDGAGRKKRKMRLRTATHAQLLDPSGAPTGTLPMTSASAQAPLPEDPVSFVSTDTAALASHMNACRQSRGRFFSLRSGGDVVRVLVSSRLVSTGALLCALGLAMFLYLS